jgi:hypothetical protein
MVLHAQNVVGVEEQLCHLGTQIQAHAEQNEQTAAVFSRTNQSLLHHSLGDSTTVLANSRVNAMSTFMNMFFHLQ